MPQEQTLRADLWQIARTALQAVEPHVCIHRALQREGKRLVFEGQSVDLSRLQRTIVVGMGKAAARMAVALEAILSVELTRFRGHLKT